MPLGIEQNNIAPALIQSGGQALVQGIRQIGQQISGHLTELQTKRDLAGLGQELQTLNPQSNEFPMQLTQVLSRHPLAARDERAQIGLSVLGKAHGQWQATQADAAAFGRQMKMQEIREAAAANRAAAAEEARRGRPISVAGVGLVQPNEIDEVTGQPKVLVPVPKKESSVLPFSSSPSGIFDRRTGEITSPAPIKTSEARMLKKDKIQSLMRQDAQASAEFARLEKRRDALSKERMELNPKDATAGVNIAYLDNTVKAIESEAEELKKRRLEIQKAIEAIELTSAGDAPAELPAPTQGSDDLGLPPLAPTAAASPTFKTADEVRAAAKGGSLSRDQAKEILRKNFGFQ